MTFSKSSKITNKEQIEFLDGALIIFNDPLGELNLNDVVIVRHYGSEITFSKKLLRDERSIILEKISIDTLRAINMTGNKSRSMANGV